MDSKAANLRFTANSIIKWTREHELVASVLLLLSLISLAAVYRWIQFSGNSAPPGSDGGQWLAFAHQLFGGEQIKAGFQSYPPLFPFFVKILSLDNGLLSLKLLGIASSVLVCVPVFLLLRTALPALLSAIIAPIVLLTPYHYEVLCFGGYPQLLGTSFMVFSTFFLLNGMDTGQKKWFLAAAITAAATAGSNVLPTIMLVATSGVVMIVTSYKLWHENRPLLNHRLRSAFVWWAIPAGMLCLAFLGTYYDYLISSESAISNNLALSSMWEWIGSSWRWEFMLWLGVIYIAAIAVIFNPKLFLGRNLLLSAGAAAFLVAGFAGFLFFRELRYLTFIEIGLVLVAGILLYKFLISLQNRSTGQAYLVCSLAIIVAAASIIGGVGLRRFNIAYNWYEVVDASVMPAMEWLDDNRIPAARVVTTEAKDGHNYGWWIEGLTHMQTYAAADPALFIDEEEHAQVALAHRLLLGDISPEEISDLAETERIHFLFLDKQVFCFPIDNFIEAGFSSAFENDTIAVLERDTRFLLSETKK